MKPYRFLFLFALLLGACAPAQTTTSSPTPAPAAAARVATAERVVELTTPPDDWWLLDAEADGVRGISVERAYRELLTGRQPQRTVVVAVIDTGVDIEHEDLRDNIWRNEGEIPGTARDDDGNGYVDDVHGWNFIGGPDGRSVHHDTYEITRIYARLHPSYGTARRDMLSEATRAEYDHYREIRRELEARRAEATQQLQQIRTIGLAVERFTAMLREHLGTDELTAEAVGGIRTTRAELRQAQQVYLQMVAEGITPAAIEEYREALEGRLEYGYNPDFDPRPIVGDNYADPRERHYGNPDVVGEFAEHGTHVAGIIGARRDNNLGINGIAPAVRIMALRVVPDGDERDKDIANAIRYAVDNGAQIINMSFGKGYSPEKEVVDEAVRYADERGVLLVHGAGNSAADVDTEANFPTPHYQGGGRARNWLTVGASAWWAADSLAAGFSNYGRERVDIFAPGVGILSTVPGNEYKANSGTSMAAPVVAGVAALLMAYYPEFDAVEIRQIILDSATRFPEQRVVQPGGRGTRVQFADLSATGGIVNAYAAIQLAEQRSAERGR